MLNFFKNLHRKWRRSERFKIGYLLILSAIVLFVIFLFFPFTHRVGVKYDLKSLADLFRIVFSGISYLFFLFLGVGAFAVPIGLIFNGYNYFSRKNRKKEIRTQLLSLWFVLEITIFGSIYDLLTGREFDFSGGVIGHSIINRLNTFAGKFGTIIIVVFVTLVFVNILWNKPVKMLFNFGEKIFHFFWDMLLGIGEYLQFLISDIFAKKYQKAKKDWKIKKYWKKKINIKNFIANLEKKIPDFFAKIIKKEDQIAEQPDEKVEPIEEPEQVEDKEKKEPYIIDKKKIFSELEEIKKRFNLFSLPEMELDRYIYIVKSENEAVFKNACDSIKIYLECGRFLKKAEKMLGKDIHLDLKKYAKPKEEIRSFAIDILNERETYDKFDWNSFESVLENIRQSENEENIYEKCLEFLNKRKKLISEELYNRFKSSLEKSQEKNFYDFKKSLDTAIFKIEFNKIIEKLINEDESMSSRIKEKLLRKSKRYISAKKYFNDDCYFDERKIDQLRDDIAQIKEDLNNVFKFSSLEEIKDTISNVENLLIERCAVDFDDIAGMVNLKNELKYAIEGPIEHYQTILEATGRPPENVGFLLYGTPGCGKSFLALATAGEFAHKYNMSIINVPVESIDGLYWGKQVERIKEIFDLAFKKSPCIVIWDEFDVYASDHTKSGRKLDHKKTTVFKQKMEGVIKSDKLIIHIATSNYPWMLEQAILRPGRLGEIRYVTPPDLSARKEIFELLLGQAKVEKDIDVRRLAEMTNNFTSAEIKDVFIKASNKPIKEWQNGGMISKPRKISINDFITAIEQKKGSSSYEAWLKNSYYILQKPKFQAMKDLFPDLVEEFKRQH